MAGEHILVIEHDELVRRTLTATLEDMGYNAISEVVRWSNLLGDSFSSGTVLP